MTASSSASHRVFTLTLASAFGFAHSGILSHFHPRLLSPHHCLSPRSFFALATYGFSLLRNSAFRVFAHTCAASQAQLLLYPFKTRFLLLLFNSLYHKSSHNLLIMLLFYVYVLPSNRFCFKILIALDTCNLASVCVTVFNSSSDHASTRMLSSSVYLSISLMLSLLASTGGEYNAH